MKHQPFIFNINGEKLLYCFYETKKTLFFGGEYQIEPWKIFIRTENYEGEVQTIKKHIDLEGELIVECNPHVILKDNKTYLGYNAGFTLGENYPIIYYYMMAELSEDFKQTKNTKLIKRRVFSSAFIGDKFFQTKKTLDKDLFLESGKEINLDINLKYIYRICPIFNDNTKLIITCGNNEDEMSSWLITTDGKTIKEIRNKENRSIYKCSIYNNKLVYAVKDGDARYLVEEEYKI